jgi:hypothetical protein
MHNQFLPFSPMPLFLDNLHHQRSLGYHLRTKALQFILNDVKLFTTSTSHFDVFLKLIGYKLATVKSQAFYDHFKIPLLYDKWDETIDMNTLSQGNGVFKVCKPPHFFSVAHFLSLFLDLCFLHPGALRCNGVV